MPKPYVHLIGPPLDLALDARWYGGKGRWVRNGCKPNAVIRPIICRRKETENGKPKEGEKGEEKETEKEGENGEAEGDDETLSFALFALKDLKANDEIVLGWEWDDGNVVHQLPALIGSDTVRIGGKDTANGCIQNICF
ncbi:hypothetical protein E1B28_008096 [Marasmius oreades]|uniref:Uncharacterized protein n=1 Tax=Marasmius oreades TaxID=181124 RepID=A0A9P7S382_9AGAR|nr:uncharacterized protein E1B28_008096 [Marasmius oreades]KAG7094497.1 hypothetical protein E1B28_008096 [Marasmius oreades]